MAAGKQNSNVQSNDHQDLDVNFQQHICLLVQYVESQMV